MSDVIRVYHTFDNSFSGDEYWQLIKTCTNIGCRLRQDENTDLITYSAVEETGRRKANLEAALDDILPAGGSITFFYKELKFDLSYYSDAIVPEFGPQVCVSIWASQFKTFGE